MHNGTKIIERGTAILRQVNVLTKFQCICKESLEEGRAGEEQIAELTLVLFTLAQQFKMLSEPLKEICPQTIAENAVLSPPLSLFLSCLKIFLK